MITQLSKRTLLFGMFGIVAVGAAIAVPLQDRSGKITPWEAMKIAEQKSNGKAIEATYEFEDGKWGYSIMVVSKGKLYEVELNAKTGRVGDVEEASASGEAKEFQSDLEHALKP
jgi:uncharacterized membrane protein YkoI